ncbi:MAG: hypothetical protein KDK50_05640 [Chlamydiia bacterium]|nr:hypothetical protein [Chlamydiia bacterium]
MVLLKEQFGASKVDEMDYLPSEVEFWTNFLLLDPYFNDLEKAREFANVLVPIWKAKLASDFPKQDFVVKVLVDDETDDVGITFFQNQPEGLGKEPNH